MDDSVRAQRALAYALDNHSDVEITVLQIVGERSHTWGEAISLALEDDLDEVAEERVTVISSSTRELAVRTIAPTTAERRQAMDRPAHSISRGTLRI